MPPLGDSSTAEGTALAHCTPVRPEL